MRLPIQHFSGLHNSGQPRHRGKSGSPWTGRNCLSRIALCPARTRSPSRRDLVFDALVAGEPGAPLVLLLHGFAESMHCWRAQVAALGDMGYRAVAPSQRGYSPGARPDPREFSHYPIDRLMDDAMAIVAAAAMATQRFHLVGHDWGGSIAWGLADRTSRAAGLAHHPLAAASRTRSTARCTSPTASRRSARGTTRRFSNPMPPMSCWPTIANGCASAWPPTGVPRDAIEQHLAVLGNKAAMEAALAWYRARGAIRAPARADPRADALYLGRCRRHRRPRRRRRHGAISSPRPTDSRCCLASGISRPTRRRNVSAN